MIRKILFLSLVIFLAAVSAPAHAFTLSNFETPESMIVDLSDGAYYVSNVNGSPFDKDGNGYISKISADGNLVIQKFIGGKKDEPLLHAPKGLVIVGANLWVTDIDSVKLFDKETGKMVRHIDFTKFGARFLNDIADDGRGNVYVSDMLTNRIFRINSINDYGVDVFSEGPQLAGPNGLRVNPKTRNLMAVTWESGALLEIDRMGGVHVLKKGFARLDGIDYDNDGNLYVSGFEKGEIYRISHWGRGSITTYLNGLITPADISCDRSRNEVLIPSFNGNTVMTSPVKRPAL